MSKHATVFLVLAALICAPSCSKRKSRAAATPEAESTTSPRGGAGASSAKTDARTVRGSKAPARPLPRLTREQEDSARARIREAKAEYNRAIAANKKSPPDKELFFSALNACKQKLDDADATLEPVTMWEEESTMEDWKVRADEDAYLRTITPILAKLDKLRAAAEKISRAR